jgi:hypothetical protein
MSQTQGEDAVPMIPYGDNTFGVGFDPNLRIVFTMDGDLAAKVTLRRGDGRWRGEEVERH